MNLSRLLQTCIRSIARNRMRSLLTSLGVIIGLGSVIIMVAMGECSRRAIETRITAMGTNLLQINHRPPPPHLRTPSTRISAFTREDLEKLKAESSFAIAISGIVQRNNVDVIGGEGSIQVRLQGVEPDFLIARNWNVNAGYFLTLMNILGCLDKPGGGTYTLDGIETSKSNSDTFAYIRNRKIGLCFRLLIYWRGLPRWKMRIFPLFYRRREKTKKR